MLSKALSSQICEHALRVFPEESCGFVIDGTVTGRLIDGEYIPLENTHTRPLEAFRIDARNTIEYEGRITAVVHSHPNGPSAPSKYDMVVQESMNIPFIIVSTNGTNCEIPFEFGDCLERQPLEGRSFRHGVSDCYEAMRDHFFVKHGLFLPFVPRDWGWWENGDDLYRDHFKPAGFRALTEDEVPQAEDCFFLCVGSKVPNHGGVYLGEGRVYHHLGARNSPYSLSHLSVVEYGTRWQSFQPTYVRHWKFDT